jgi:ABC-type transport system involved in multi-copper enzyme maturation permease subunit
MGPLNALLGRDLTLPHAAAVMAGYTVVFGGLLVWLFLRRDVE